MLGRDEAILEGWTTLSALGGATHRAQLGMIHQSHYFRSAAITAKMSATLDHLTGGRFVLFYDYGQQVRENRAYHLPYPEDVEQRVAETVDGARLIRDLWMADKPVTVSHGKSGVTGATCMPLPVTAPPIWFGEVHPGLLAACAEFGNGWNTTPCSVADLRRRLGLLEGACAAVGRDPGEIETSIELQVLIAPEGEVSSTLATILEKAPDADQVVSDLGEFAAGRSVELPGSLTNSTLVGTPDQVIEQVRAYVDAGVDHFMLWFLDAPDRRGMDLFAQEVAPRFR